MACELRENIQFGKGSLVFGKNVVADKNRLCRRLSHSPHQSHIKHEKLEGIMVFIELERQTWSIHPLNLIYQTCINEPLYGEFEIGCPGTFLHRTIYIFLVFLCKLGRNAVPHKIDARNLTGWGMLGEIAPIVLQHLILYCSYLFQPSLLHMCQHCGWLNILNCTLPPVGIILVLGYFLNKEKYQDVEVSETVNWFAVIGVVLGALIMVIGYTLGRAFIYSTPEYAILKLLMQNPGQVLAKSVLLDRISADTPDCTENSLKTHISNLRGKLRAAAGREYVEAVWGIGFRLKTGS